MKIIGYMHSVDLGNPSAPVYSPEEFRKLPLGRKADISPYIAVYAGPEPLGESEQEVWIAFNSADDNEPVMFFTELPGEELKSRFVLKHYICRPAP